jgi:hypothetical protein
VKKYYKTHQKEINFIAPIPAPVPASTTTPTPTPTPTVPIPAGENIKNRSCLKKNYCRELSRRGGGGKEGKEGKDLWLTAFWLI